jgi:aerobic-type carbon monoxide dehydrogenase small subunit (CoxS/CutS family)
MKNIKCSFNINSTSKTLSINEDKPLLFVIRDEFGLTGTKLGCGLEQCGSCAVLIDGEKKLSCNVLAKDFQNCEIVTIEGLETDNGLNVVQNAFKKFNAAQCGYCTSGIIISLTSVFNKKPKPTKDEIISCLKGHFCRCGSHNSIFQAIESIKSELS